MISPDVIRRCFDAHHVLYSGHARHEMQVEEFGPITDQEVYEAVCTGEILESYPEDTPYPSVLLLGTTQTQRPLHLVCAYNQPEDQVIMVTIYHPDPALWEDSRRRRG